MMLIAITVTFIVGNYTGHVDADVFRQGDFKAFYTAGLIVNEARGEDSLDLYDIEKQISIQDQYDIIGPGEELTIFLNPPAYAWLMAPISKLPYVTALNLWRLISIAVASISIVILTRRLKLDFKWWDTLTILLVSFPGFVVMISGQNTFLFIGLYAFSFGLLMRGHDFSAGALLGLGALKPQLFLFLPVVLLFQKKWHALMGFAAGSLSVLLFSAAMIGPGGLIEYFQLFTTDVYSYGIQIQADKMHSFPAFVRLLFGLEINPTYLALFTALALTAVFAYLSLKRGYEFEVSSLYSLAILGTIIINPHLFHYDLALLLLPFLFIYSWTRRNELSYILSRNLRLALVLLFAYLWLGFLFIEMIKVQVSVLLIIYLFVLILNKRKSS